MSPGLRCDREPVRASATWHRTPSATTLESSGRRYSGGRDDGPTARRHRQRAQKALAALIDEVVGQEHPVFVTQYGVVTAVLISRKEYESQHRAGERSSRERYGTSRASAVPATPPAHRSRRLTPQPAGRIWTQYGWHDFEVAEVLAEQGVETELVFTEEGWMTDDEG